MKNWGQRPHTETEFRPGVPYPDGGSPMKDLISGFMEEARRLVKAEIALARGDLKEEAKKVQAGGKSVGIGAGLALAGGLTLVACLVLALATFMPAWVAALLVGAVLCGIGAVLANGGIKRIKTADPKKSIERLEEDRQWLTGTIQKSKAATHSSVTSSPRARA